MVTIEQLRDYVGALPETTSGVLQMCLDAAKTKARNAGIPDFKHNAQYDLFLCALAGFWYDNRSFSFIGAGGRSTAGAEENSRKLINAFVLELRHATEDEPPVKEMP